MASSSMAFSFRMGTKRCHDFPKLARESGFYFNMHRSRVRVDWNRISNIDVDRIIRDRDFHAIDDNINIVIDYCLESEYDVKILDPSFVKLFRLAQLAVEYLLYCKQYLDHSVVILKDELRSKIEENVKLKKETATLEEVVNHLKEKAKDRSKSMESKIGDCNGEIYKCPHCPKTFISSMFVSAHIIRRHGYMSSDLCVTSSSIHEHYQNETKKLHNEIKSLKERLNETERVIRNESERIPEKKAVAYDKRHLENEAESFKCDTNKSEEHPEYRGYQEEIKNLKTMLFDEIHHLRQKEKNMYERTPETNVQTLINQQEKEFQKLRNQLFEKLTPDIEGVQAKLYTQENYWRSKIERVEEQHRKDVERLSAELKLTQKAADGIKAEYEFKVNDLERQTANQSNILKEQSRRLNSLSREINVSQLNERNKNVENDAQNKSDRSKSNESDLEQKDYVDTSSQMIVGDINSILSSDLSVSKVFPSTLRTTVSRNLHTLNPRYKTVTCEEKRNVKQESKVIKVVKSKKNVEKDLKYCSSNDTSESQNSVPEKRVNQETTRINHDHNDDLISKADLNESKDTFDRNMHQKFLSMNSSKGSEALEDDLNSEINSEPSMSESQTQSETESFTILRNNSPMHKHKKLAAVLAKSKKTAPHDSSHKKLRENLRLTFEQKLRDLGIDPEWQGIPKATFKQKMDILRHHEKITMRKLPKYHQVKLKIIEELVNKISNKGKTMENFKPVKRLMPLKAFGDLKAPANSISRNATPNKLHSTSKVDRSVKGRSDGESTPIKSTKTLNNKSIESLIQISPSLLKSVKTDSMNRVKCLFDDSANNTNERQELENVSMSPKHNKSALKTAFGSTSSLTKKKVIFHLADENDRESLSDYDVRKDELHSVSVSAYEQSHLAEQENYKNTGNIVLKTSQSDKIAEISKKLEAQLSMVRQKPVGSIETIFSSKYIQNREDHNTNDNQRKTSASVSSLLESPFEPSTFSSKVTKNQAPQPAPRNLKDKTPESSHTESISEISDLDSDIDKILKLE